ncbi:MAG: hypothetical protein F4Y95_10270 [Chloroflexi bacterium]|nr:hypothetical protein [Chloroflexota bacterium]
MTGLNTDALNRTIFISDNLPFLKQLDTGSVALVVIDPPFGKQQTFEGRLTPPLSDAELDHEYDLLAGWGIQNENEAYEAGLEFPDQSGQTAKFRDIWDFRYQVTEEQWHLLEDRAPAALHLIETIRYVHSDERAAYITFMALRLIELRRVLKPDGSIYLHCDQFVSSYLRLLLDAVFGQGNFRNEIVWRRTSGQKGTRGPRKTLGMTTEAIHFYANSDAHVIEVPRTKQITRGMRPFKHEDDRGVYRAVADLYADAALHDSPRYEWRDHNPPHGWRVSLENLEQLHAQDRIHYNSNGKPFRKQYRDEWEGAEVSSLWTDIPQARGAESTGYPTQKPQALARRIIETSSNPGDLVLDCFAGCAYVPVAAELTGRRWIGCDMSPRAWTVVRRQFEKQPDLRIVTEGRLTAEAIEPRLEHHDRVIKVRGPNQLPERTTAEDPVSPSFLTSDPPRFRQTALETSQAIWEAFVEYWGAECWYCGAPRARDRRELQLDHIEPNARDGSNDDCWNRALACSPCNGDKGNRLTPEELIKLALLKQRIETEALMNEQLGRFRERHAWAQNRWETEVKPQHEQGELALS